MMCVCNCCVLCVAVATIYINPAACCAPPGDFMRDFSDKLVPLLEDEVRVLIYAGDQDLICNWLGNRRWVDALQWSGAQGWATAADKNWTLDGEVVGSVKQYDTLTFAKVFQAVSVGGGVLCCCVCVSLWRCFSWW